MKRVGKPRYYLGGDVVDLGKQWEKDGLKLGLSANTYIQNCIPKLSTLLNVEHFPKKKTPMDAEYHPELDDSPLLDPEGI